MVSKKVLYVSSLIALCLIISACSPANFSVNGNSTSNPLQTEKTTNKTSHLKADYNTVYEEARDEEYWQNISNTPASDFDYYFINDTMKENYNIDKSANAICISSYKGNDDIVKIPDEIEGASVCVISTTFLTIDESHDKEVKELYIPDSVVILGDYTMAAYRNIKRLRLPRKINESSSSSSVSFFCNMPSLKKLVLPSQNVNKAKSIHFSSGCFDSLEEIYFGEGTKKIEIIEEDIFNNSNSLKYIGIPSSVESICKLKYEMQGDYLTYIEEEINPFTDCNNITIICEKGSYAENYAEKYGIKTKLL